MTSSPKAPPYRVLVVDDEPHLVRAVRMYLELQGYTVFGAHSGWHGGGAAPGAV